MSEVDIFAAIGEAMTPYYDVLCKYDLTASELMAAANVLRDLEEDPHNCVDYRSIAIAINEAKGE